MIRLDMEEIFPEAPIWDRGTMTRGLTLSETRALCHAFREMRQRYGECLLNEAKQAEAHAKEHREMLVNYVHAMNILIELATSKPGAQGKRQVQAAKRKAKQYIKAKQYDQEQYEYLDEI